jgi:acyl carrier protein
LGIVAQDQNTEDSKLPEEIAGKVIASIAKVKKIHPAQVKLDSTFEELKMDSLDGLDVLFELEEAFDVTIPDDRARSIRTVGSVVDAIQKLLVKQKTEAGQR